MIIDPDFLDHWRTAMLADSLGLSPGVPDPMAPLYLIRLWAHCQTRKSVRHEGMPASGLKAVCKAIPHDPEAFELAMIRAGYVERDGDAINVLKWATHNAALIAAWDNGGKGGRPKGSGNKPSNNPWETHGKPTGNPTLTHGEPIGLDKSREDTEHQELSSLRSDSSTAPPLDLTPPSADNPESRAARNAEKLSAITEIVMAEYNAHLSKKAGGLLRQATKVGVDQHRRHVSRCLKVASRACMDLFKEPRIRPEFWKGYFRRCAEDPFLSGRQGGGKDHANWLPDLEYLTRPATMLKIYEMHAQDGDE